MNKIVSVAGLLVLVGVTIWFYSGTKTTPGSSELSDLTATSTEQAATSTAVSPSATPAVTPKPKTTSKPAAKPSTTSGDKTGQQEVQITTPGIPAKSTVTITYSDTGFTPSSITVAPGTTLEFINRSNGLMWVASNPHPSHTSYPGFDALRAYGFGESYRFTISGAGRTYGYHNHVNPGKTGTVTVK